jgi:hypothetical protein
MTKLDKEEIEYIQSLSSDYKKFHGKIKEIEKVIEHFSDKAKKIIAQLEETRENEKKFISALKDKYGEGNINVSSLSWEQKKEEKSEN